MKHELRLGILPALLIGLLVFMDEFIKYGFAWWGTKAIIFTWINVIIFGLCAVVLELIVGRMKMVMKNKSVAEVFKDLIDRIRTIL